MRRFIIAILLLALGAAACSKSARQYFDSGNKYYAGQKYQEATVEFRNAIQKDPRFAEARIKLAECYEKLGDLGNAGEQWVRAADLAPANVNAQLKAGNYLLLTGKFKDAAARADNVLKRDPKNGEALVVKGNAAAGQQDLEGAVKQMEEAIRVDPNAPAPYYSLGVIETRKGNLQAAEQAYRQAVQVAPKAIMPHVALAFFLGRNNRQDEAEAAYKAAYDIDPKNVLVNSALASFYVNSGRPDKAEPYLKTIADTTKDPRASLTLADYYTSSRRTGEAMALLQKLSASPRMFAPAKTRIAVIQYAEGKTADAHKTVDEVLAKEPKNDEALVIKSRFFYTEKRMDEALSRAQAAVAANPRSINAHYLLGSLYATKENPDAAATEFNEVLKLNPGVTAAQLQLSRIEMLKGRAASAVQFAEQAVASSKQSGLARLMLVRSLALQGETQRAERELQPLLKVFPNAAPVHITAGVVAMTKKDFAAAQRSFEKAIQLEPQSIEPLAGLVDLHLATGKTADAKKLVDARLAASPQDPAALSLAGRTYFLAGDNAGAEPLLVRTIQAAPGNLQAYGLLGQVYLRQRKLDEARAKFEELAKRQAKPYGAETMIAMILQLQGKPAEARKRYEKALQIEPTAAVAANNLAWMYSEAKDGDLNVALQLAQTAKVGLSDSPEVDDTLGWIYVKKNLPGLAVRPLEAAVKTTSQKNPTYLYHLGAAYAQVATQTGDKDAKAKAKATLESAFKLSQNFEGAADAKKLLETLK